MIDGGRITVGEGQEESPESRRGSTVVNLSQPGKFSIIREGRCVRACVCVKEKSSYSIDMICIQV